MRKLYAIGAAFVAVAFLAVSTLFATGYIGGTAASGDRFAACRSSAVAGGGELGGPFELINATGETVTDKDVITEPSLVYFGYTFCPDVCPLDVYRNAEAVDILAERGMSVTPVFITIDPARDTPDVVGDFAANAHPRMVGLTGSPEQIKAASQAYRSYYKAHEAVDGEYLVDHSTFTYLIMPEDGFVEFFRREVAPQEMADQIGCFVEKL